ncbi:MAG: hypothetical protein WC178_03860 [Candidatus Paceibacterota bacterium]
MSVEDFIEDNKEKLKMFAMLVLVFSLGFASGYYYLDNGAGNSVLAVRDNSADCNGLFRQSEEVASSPNSESVAITDGTEQNAEKTTISDSNATSGLFAASKSSTLYHSRDCQYVNQIKPENLIWFSSEKEAEAAGYKPHSCVGG